MKMSANVSLNRCQKFILTSLFGRIASNSGALLSPFKITLGNLRLTEKTHQAFPGRIIFDHLPKTAGSAVHAWLIQALGNACITPHLVGNSRDLIRRYGGNYSIISGHVHFSGEGLDPRYQYVTCLREPIDRSLSWLFFVLKNHNTNQIPEQWIQVERFISSQGEEIAPALLEQISNPYVSHFASILNTAPCSDDIKLTNAVSAIEQYDCCGPMEDMPAFLSKMAALIGLPTPRQIERVNVTRSRPLVSDVSASLRKNLEDLNRLDLEFYRILHKHWKIRKRRNNRIHAFGYCLEKSTEWKPYTNQNRRANQDEFTILSAALTNRATVSLGEPLSFIIDFALARTVKELVIGIHILDEDNLRAFGTNTALLERPLLNVNRGTYRIRYDLTANLPEGEYKAGFAFVEHNENQDLELAWHDHLLTFRISVPRLTPSIGYTSLPVTFDFQQCSNELSERINDASGTIRSETLPSKISSGESFILPVHLENTSTQIWVNNDLRHPINLSYHWLDRTGTILIFEGERTRLTVPDIAPGQVVSTQMRISAPNIPGYYQLLLLPVQEMYCWFDELGFQPEIRDVTVSAAPYATSAQRQPPDTPN